MLEAGVESCRIIYANPCKTNSHIRYAAKSDVRQMTFDNTDELRKIQQCFPAAELFLRISTDDSSSVCRLSLKFGASMDSTEGLLALAKQLNLNVVGISFHVGSGATDPQVFLRAIQDARTVFDQAAEIGFDIKTIDVGGGFSSDTFEAMAHVLSQALEDYIPPHIRVIGEPGRYYVARAFTLACSVIARRTIRDPDTQVVSYMAYLNDGLYGNFSCIMFDHQHPVPKLLRARGRFLHDRPDSEQVTERYVQRPIEYSIWGPTCDGIDCITSSCTLPETLDVGDWLYFDDMGGKCQPEPNPLNTDILLTKSISIHQMLRHALQRLLRQPRCRLRLQRARCRRPARPQIIEGLSCRRERHGDLSCVCVCQRDI